MRREIVLAGKRLAYYYRRPSQEYWEDLLLRQTSLHNAINKIKRDEIFNTIVKYVRRSPVLDAGCGLAFHVKALHDMGFYVIGLDFASKLLKRAKREWPQLELIVGDVKYLPFRPRVFNAIISLGVIEHFIEGPQEVIKELSCILKDYGVVAVSVPWINALRRFKQILRLYRRSPSSNLEFYQYVFPFKEVRTMLKGYGFRLLFSTPYDPILTLKDEFPWLKPILSKLIELFEAPSQHIGKATHPYHKKIKMSISNILRNMLKIFTLCLTLLTGHMRLYIAVKLTK